MEKVILTALAIAALAALVNTFAGPDASWCVLKRGIEFPADQLMPKSKC